MHLSKLTCWNWNANAGPEMALQYIMMPYKHYEPQSPPWPDIVCGNPLLEEEREEWQAARARILWWCTVLLMALIAVGVSGRRWWHCADRVRARSGRLKVTHATAKPSPVVADDG